MKKKKKTILMAVLLAGTALFSQNASAATTSYDGVYNLTYGNLGAPTPYGSITVTTIAGTDSVSVHEVSVPQLATQQRQSHQSCSAHLQSERNWCDQCCQCVSPVLHRHSGTGG